MGIFDVTANDVPAIRIAKAIGDGVNKNILFVVDGGIGDRICAEPTLRYAMTQFKDLQFSLLCQTPELFEHLPFKKIYLELSEVPQEQYLALHTYGTGNLSNQFFNANLMHAVDFASVSALRMQLPVEFKKLYLSCSPTKTLLKRNFFDNIILIHPGKTWQSRTVPKEWWEALVCNLVASLKVPVIIGNKTIDIDTKNCVDLRNCMSLSQCVYMSQMAPLVTNDSGPLHMAAAGYQKIAYLSTVRHPDLLKHWRFDGTGVTALEYGWNMRNFTKGKPWEMFVSFPNDLDPRRADKFPEGVCIEDFLPDPKEVVEWMI